MADFTKDLTLPDGATVTLEMDGTKSIIAMGARDDNTARFTSGGAGYHGQGKVVGKDGRVYQVNFLATLLHSNPDKEAKAQAAAAAKK